MANLVGNWPAQDYSKKLIKHLRSRTMPGLPHIGVVGPAPQNVETEDNPVDVDTSDSSKVESLSEVEDDELDWNFVPNKVKYHMTIEPTPESSNETKIDFYIRVKEGSDGDVGKDLTKLGRPPEYVLSEDDLKRVFRHYELFIFSKDDVVETTARLLVNGNEHEIPQQDFRTQDNVVEITLHDTSDPFINYDRGVPRLVRQEYKIVVTKEIKSEGNQRNIIVQVTNKSPKTKRSSLLIRKDGESEDSCKKRMKASGDKKHADLGADPFWPDWNPSLYKVQGAGNNPEGNRYSYLMEFFASEKISSYVEPIKQKDVARITNLVFDYSSLDKKNDRFEGNIVFRDHAMFEEQVPKMKDGATPKEAIEKLGLSPKISEVLDETGYEKLHRFQEDSIEKILDAVSSESKNTVLISARTAGGKTEAFLIPILETCLKTKELGVKAIIFYPTKALANNQASRFINILYHLNKKLDQKITVGILHGDISKYSDQIKEEDTAGLPFECPKCGIGLLRPTDPGHVECDNHSCLEKLDFVWAHSRLQNYSRPPDILITNPDTIIWDLMLRPVHHSIFGREVYACQDCGLTYAPSGSKITCNGYGGCNGKNLEKITPTPPSFLVFDEIHLFKGSFGINCSYFLSRLEKTIKHYANVYHSRQDHKIIRIGSTATISNVKEFVEKFFNVKEDCYWLIPESKKKLEEYYVYGESDKSFKRHHVFVMPYAYASDSTVGMAIQYLEALAKNGKPPTRLDSPGGQIGHYLQILTFVNAIKTSNSLISQTRRTVVGELPDLQIDGHTTDFDKKQRSVVERKFNMHDLHVVFATSTLEVGVDFRSIHCVVINGFPYSFNDYLQRIGRGGRKNDSLVLTVCQNWKPVDHYYYTHGERVLKEQYENIEPVPITRENSEAIKKHVQGALLDHIVRSGNSVYDIEDIQTLKSLEENRDEINADVLSSCGLPPSLEEAALTHLDEFVYYLTQMAKTAGTSGKSKTLYSRFLDEINPKYNLTSLRSTDPEVIVEVFWNR